MPHGIICTFMHENYECEKFNIPWLKFLFRNADWSLNQWKPESTFCSVSVDKKLRDILTELLIFVKAYGSYHSDQNYSISEVYERLYILWIVTYDTTYTKSNFPFMFIVAVKAIYSLHIWAILQNVSIFLHSVSQNEFHKMPRLFNQIICPERHNLVTTVQNCYHLLHLPVPFNFGYLFGTTREF